MQGKGWQAAAAAEGMAEAAEEKPTKGAASPPELSHFGGLIP